MSHVLDYLLGIGAFGAVGVVCAAHDTRGQRVFDRLALAEALAMPPRVRRPRRWGVEVEQ